MRSDCYRKKSEVRLLFGVPSLDPLMVYFWRGEAIFRLPVNEWKAEDWGDKFSHTNNLAVDKALYHKQERNCTSKLEVRWREKRLIVAGMVCSRESG